MIHNRVWTGRGWFYPDNEGDHMSEETQQGVPRVDSDPAQLAAAASNVIKLAMEGTQLSLAELAVVFTIASKSCEETAQMHETANMRFKLRQWRPGR